MNSRSLVFWGLDMLRGGKVRKALSQVEKDMKREHNNQEKLREILQYAIDNVPYYGSFQRAEIKEFPVMNKKKYLERYDDFLSKEHKGQDLYTYYTSGSSGTPFSGVQDKEKRIKHTADLLYFHGKCGWKLGEKYIFLRAWVSSYNSSYIQNIKNNVIPLNVLELNEQMLANIVHMLRTQPIKMILGYGSALNRLADYLEKKDIYCKGLHTVISDSDILLREKRIILQQRLGCKIVDRYSNEEHGLIAFSYDVGMPYQVNHSSYFVEILKMNSDEYVDKGELGRVVVTDLYNRAMPLIRYELGDLAISDDDDRCGVYTIRGLQGRLADMLVQKNGVEISAATINNYMEHMTGIERYQLIQKDIGSFVLYVIDPENKYTDDQYYDALLPCIESESELKVVRTNHIETEKTGKFQTFVSMRQ